MVWEEITYYDAPSMVGLERDMEFVYYYNILKNALFSGTNNLFGDVWTFVQDDASLNS